MVKSAFENTGSYDWVGSGIGSSSAQARGLIDGATGLGVVSNDQLGYSSFSGRTGLTGSANEILIKYTWLGDADLDGDVDGDDFTAFLTGTSTGTGGWELGDFDYDNDIDGDDFTAFLTGMGGYGSEGIL